MSPMQSKTNKVTHSVDGRKAVDVSLDFSTAFDIIFVSKIKRECHTPSISYLNCENLSAWTVFWTQCNLKYLKCKFLPFLSS